MLTGVRKYTVLVLLETTFLSCLWQEKKTSITAEQCESCCGLVGIVFALAEFLKIWTRWLEQLHTTTVYLRAHLCTSYVGDDIYLKGHFAAYHHCFMCLLEKSSTLEDMMHFAHGWRKIIKFDYYARCKYAT